MKTYRNRLANPQQTRDCVPYQPARCAKCGTAGKVTKTIRGSGHTGVGTIRYHECPACGYRFVSLEK